jgi:hypothetical protein
MDPDPDPGGPKTCPLRKLKLLIKKLEKSIKFFSSCQFCSVLAIIILDQDLIRILIVIQPKMHDPDPESINPDPKPCFVYHLLECPKYGTDLVR